MAERLSGAQLTVLENASHGPVDAEMMSWELDREPAKVTPMLDRLYKRRLLDRVSYVYFLTAKGREALAAAHRAMQAED